MPPQPRSRTPLVAVSGIREPGGVRGVSPPGLKVYSTTRFADRQERKGWWVEPCPLATSPLLKSQAECLDPPKCLITPSCIYCNMNQS